MGSIRRGFRLAGVSWRVVRQDKQLLWLPVFSFVCLAVVAVVFGIAAIGIGLPKQSESVSPLLYALGFCFYAVAAFVAIFFNAAVIGTAMKRLRGEPATIRDGLLLARRHLGKIFAWAVLTATVGMVLRVFEQKAGFLGRLVLGAIGLAWNIITFFVVPVLLFENFGVSGSLRRSAQLFKDRWGEQLTGNATIGLVLFLAGFAVAAVTALVWFLAPVLAGVAVGVAIVAIGVIAAFGTVLSGVFNAALYRYATTGEASGGFTDDDLNQSFRKRRRERQLDTVTV
jgi:Family of unknown function (DUF6159)